MKCRAKRRILRRLAQGRYKFYSGNPFLDLGIIAAAKFREFAVMDKIFGGNYHDLRWLRRLKNMLRKNK